MIITKVKISAAGLVAISYTKEAQFAKKKDETTEKDVLTLESHDAPTPDFEASMQSLDRHFAEMLGLDTEKAMPATLRINSLTMSYNKDGNETCTISASKPIAVSNSPVNMSMTNVGEEHWSEGLRQTIEAIREHAEAYVEGTRAQPSLDLREDDVDEGADPDEDADSTPDAREEIGSSAKPAKKGKLQTIGRRGRKGEKSSEQRLLN